MLVKGSKRKENKQYTAFAQINESSSYLFGSEIQIFHKQVTTSINQVTIKYQQTINTN